MLKPDVEIKVMITQTMADALGETAARQDLTEGAIVREALRRLLEAEEKNSSVAPPCPKIAAQPAPIGVSRTGAV